MAVNQYIGAAYVAHGFTPWNAQTSYDGMYVVEYQNGNYISKKPVPAGVAPAGNQQNNEYWFWFGVKSAQIDEYINDVQEVQNNLNTLDEKVDNIGNKNIIIIGDSYAVGTYAQNIVPYPTLIANTFNLTEGINIHTYAHDGWGFTGTASNSFLTLLNQAINDISNKNDITEIMFVGGTNDQNATLSDITDAINTTIVATRVFPKAKIYVIYCALSLTKSFNNVKNAYMTCGIWGARYINIESAFHNYKYIQYGDVHPNQTGQNYIASALKQIIVSGDFNSFLYTQAVITTELDGTISGIQFVEKDIITIQLSANLKGTFNANNFTTIGTITNALYAKKFGRLVVGARGVNGENDSTVTVQISINDNGEILINPLSNSFTQIIISNQTLVIPINACNTVI